MNEKLLEQKAEEYMINHFCKKVDEEYMIKECEEGSRTRCIEFEVRKQMLVEFAEQETKLLSEHILELIADKGKLIDENRKAKEIIKEFLQISVASVEEYEPEFSELIDRAEQFLGDEK